MLTSTSSGPGLRTGICVYSTSMMDELSIVPNKGDEDDESISRKTYFHPSYAALEPIAFQVFAVPTLSKLLLIGNML